MCQATGASRGTYPLDRRALSLQRVFKHSSNPGRETFAASGLMHARGKLQLRRDYAVCSNRPYPGPQDCLIPQTAKVAIPHRLWEKLLARETCDSKRAGTSRLRIEPLAGVGDSQQRDNIWDPRIRMAQRSGVLTPESQDPPSSGAASEKKKKKKSIRPPCRVQEVVAPSGFATDSRATS